MSTEYWHNYGYGINVDKINEPTANQLRNLIDSSPETREELFRWIFRELSQNNTTTISTAKIEKYYKDLSADDLYDLFYDNDDYDGSGLSHIIRRVLNDKLKIGILCCRDCNSDDSFVIMGTYYPWEFDMFPNLKKIKTENDIRSFFAENLAMITNQTMDDLDWDLQSIEGCE